jgi:phage shock protein C
MRPWCDTRRRDLQSVAIRWRSGPATPYAYGIASKQECAMSESDELYKLGELHRSGVLTDDEFARAKARVLSGAAAAGDEAPALAAINALRRSRGDRWLGGVCGGIARMTGLASWVWRALFTCLALCGGAGVLAYVLLWVFVPMERSELGRTADPSPAG